MSALIDTDRVHATATTSATLGRVRFVPTKSIWLVFHVLAGTAGILIFPQVDAALVFVFLTAVTVCAGHSVGMHRWLIHKSFQTHRLVSYMLVWLGMLVGMAGPFGMIRAHDMRDWHQRQHVCPPHPSHGAGFWKDAYWQLMCEFRLEHPPEFKIESDIAEDPVFRFLERTWMAQQLPVAAILYICGGWAWILWGISLRIAVSLIAHWAVGHFAHRRGQQNWLIDGLPMQGYNLPSLWWLTFGENWHGNHHAFPHSARLGGDETERDPGFWFVTVLERLGCAWAVQLPDSQPAREGLVRVAEIAGRESFSASDGTRDTTETSTAM